MTRDKATAPKELEAEIHHCLKLSDPKSSVTGFSAHPNTTGLRQGKCVSKFNLLTEQLRERVLESLQDS